jgi:hypothetical protein
MTNPTQPSPDVFVFAHTLKRVTETVTVALILREPRAFYSISNLNLNLEVAALNEWTKASIDSKCQG